MLTLRVGGDEEGAAPREIVLRVGAPVPDNDSQRFVARSGFEFAGRVWASSVERLIEDHGLVLALNTHIFSVYVATVGVILQSA